MEASTTPTSAHIEMETKSAALHKQGSVKSLFVPDDSRVELAFQDITFSVFDKKTKQMRNILNGVNGVIRPGELVGVMGPSGCGKTTLLDFLANRISSGVRSGAVLLNGVARDSRTFRHIARYVPQEDHLMGTMTVLETLQFSAELSLPQSIDAKTKQQRVQDVIDQLGLTKAVHTPIGTVFTKGISGGQKRRVSMGVELIARPKVLFLDEPTSGLDSSAAFAVVSVLKELAREGHTVVCTIHQPSSAVFHMLDKVLLLSRGRTIYFGPTEGIVDYFAATGRQCPAYTNPSDFIMDIVNTDFDQSAAAAAAAAASASVPGSVHHNIAAVGIDPTGDNNDNNNADAKKNADDANNDGDHAGLARAQREQEVQALADRFNNSDINKAILQRIQHVVNVASGAAAASNHSNANANANVNQAHAVVSIDAIPKAVADGDADDANDPPQYTVSFAKQFVELAKRSWLDNLRNPGILWVRLVMYVLLSLMIGTMYLGIGRGQDTVNDRTSILFFIAAFMVFMSISVIPAFISERAVFVRERANGWYNVAAYVLANFLTGTPGIFLIALVSSLTIYFMVGLNSDQGRFGIFLLDLFLSLMCAESLMLVISAVVPMYIIGMALGAGIFGMFMLCEGFFVIPAHIPPYWIWGYYIGFHTYSFEMFMFNEFDGLQLKCDVIPCRFKTGNDVLSVFDMSNVRIWVDVVVLISMMVIFRIIFFLILQFMHKGKK